MRKTTINFKTLSIFIAIMAFSLSTLSNNSYGLDGGGNADGDHTGETGFNITEGSGSEGGNCGNGPHTHAGNAICPNKTGGGGGTSIPLDGGLSILLAGAALFGIKKLREKK